MADVITVLSIAGIIIVIGFLANVLFKKTNFPDTLFLVATGVILGPVFGVIQQEEMLPVIPLFTALTLMIILFEGGLEMELHRVFAQSPRAAILAITYVSAATVFIVIFGYFVLGMTLLEALILGPMTAGTSSVVIIPLVSKLALKKELGVMLSLESSVTDVLNIVLVLAFLHIYTSGLVDVQQTASIIIGKFTGGIVFGLIIGFIWTRILVSVGRQEFNYMLTVAALILCYAVTEYVGGSGSLAALLFGLTLGNYKAIHRMVGASIDPSKMSRIVRVVKNFQDEIAFLVRAFFFVFLGLLYMPNLEGILFAALIVGVNLVFRYLAVNVSTAKSPLAKHKMFMTLMCGTGLANATLSILVYNALIGMASPSSNAYLYPLIVTNVIVITNIITTLTPFFVKTKE